MRSCVFLIPKARDAHFEHHVVSGALISAVLDSPQMVSGDLKSLETIYCATSGVPCIAGREAVAEL